MTGRNKSSKTLRQETVNWQYHALSSLSFPFKFLLGVMISSLRKIFAVLLVPSIAVLSAYLLGYLQDYLIVLRGTPALHDDYYVAPDLGTYLISLYALGFVPAVLLRKFTGTLLAAVTPALAITAYQLIQLYLEGFLSFVSISSILSYYPLNWFIALLVGLLVWGTQERENKT